MDYNPKTGVFKWKVNRGAAVAGAVAGCVRKVPRPGAKVRGDLYYRIIRADMVVYLAHRLAWLMYYGKWPSGEVVHRNGNGLDNRATNLRETSRLGIARNRVRRVDNLSGITGVYWNERRGRWEAQIGILGKNEYLGTFSNLKEAAAVRAEAADKYGFHKNHGQE